MSNENDPTTTEPSIPLATVVDWLNEHAAQTDETADLLKLKDEISPPAPVTDPEATKAERAIGRLIGRQEILRDFAGMLEAQTVIAHGDLDDPSMLIDGKDATE